MNNELEQLYSDFYNAQTDNTVKQKLHEFYIDFNPTDFNTIDFELIEAKEFNKGSVMLKVKFFDSITVPSDYFIAEISFSQKTITFIL